jgi:hypothetical protein
MLRERLLKALADNAWTPPRTWTRRMFLDPGHSTTACLFIATPPPDLGDFVVAYDELYLHGCDTHQTAQAVRQKVSGQALYEWFIDGRIARQSVVGLGGVTYHKLYADAFQQLGLQTIQNSYGFTLANDDEAAGIMAVRSWLSLRENGTPKFFYLIQFCPHLENELTMLRKKIVKDETEDKVAGGQPDHLADCLRYAAMSGCEHVPLSQEQLAPESPVYRFFREQWQQQPATAGQQTIHCGPGSVQAA